MDLARLTYYRRLARKGNVAARKVADAFDPDQPRDADGKWGSGGGNSAKQSEGSGMPAHVLQSLQNEEARSVDEPKEHAYCLGSDGYVLLNKSGTSKEVSITAGELAYLKDGHFTHNHPMGNSLSVQDLNVAIAGNVATMRAVGRDKIDGKVYVYSFTRPETGWPIFLADTVAGKDAAVEAILGKQVRDGTLSPRDASLSHAHERWMRVQKDVDIGYRREEVKP